MQYIQGETLKFSLNMAHKYNFLKTSQILNSQIFLHLSTLFLIQKILKLLSANFFPDLKDLSSGVVL